MSTAAATEASPPPKGKKKLLVIVAAAVLVLALGGGGAMFLLKKKPAESDSEGGEAAPAHAAAKHDAHATPTFVPLDPFTVNLADRQAERYAQVGITLEIDDPHLADQIKLYMPAIRNNILLALADRTAEELMGRDGKSKLAERIKRETSKALGIEVEDEEEAKVEADADDADKTVKSKKKKKAKKAAAALPIRGVHFSNFIIQ